MMERNQADSGCRGRREICVAWLVALMIPLTSAAAPQVAPDAAISTGRMSKLATRAAIPLLIPDLL